MNLLALAATCLLATPMLCPAAGIDTTENSADSVRDTLVKIENDRDEALVNRDVATFSRCVADDWVLTTSEGALVSKSMAQADIRQGTLRIESFRLDDVKVRVYGDAAVVSGLITEKSALRGKDTSGTRRFTDVFIKRGGNWQAVASHESEASAGQ